MHGGSTGFQEQSDGHHAYPRLETALSDQARQRGVAPEALALDALRERFLTPLFQRREV